jgi:hypothetical protein
MDYCCTTKHVCFPARAVPVPCTGQWRQVQLSCRMQPLLSSGKRTCMYAASEAASTTGQSSACTQCTVRSERCAFSPRNRLGQRLCQRADSDVNSDATLMHKSEGRRLSSLCVIILYVVVLLAVKRGQMQTYLQILALYATRVQGTVAFIITSRPWHTHGLNIARRAPECAQQHQNDHLQTVGNPQQSSVQCYVKRTRNLVNMI